jgi:regulator of replication initiation timing
MSADQVVITLLAVALLVLLVVALVLVRDNQMLEADAKSEARWADLYSRENRALCKKVEQAEKAQIHKDLRWQELEDALLADWDDECDGLITEIGELHEKINAQDYVIGALKTQVADAQQAGMVLQIEREQLKAELQTYIWEVEARKANGDSWRDALDKIMASAGVEWWEGEPPADEVIAYIEKLKTQVRQKLYPEYERLTSENERLRTAPCGDEKLMTMAEWASLSAESRARINAYGQEHERLAAYANAGKVTEGCDSNIPY